MYPYNTNVKSCKLIKLETNKVKAINSSYKSELKKPYKHRSVFPHSKGKELSPVVDSFLVGSARLKCIMASGTKHEFYRLSYPEIHL